MRRSTLAICALLTVATFGCDKLKLAYEKIRGRQTPTQASPPATAARPGQPQATDTAAGRRTAAQPQRPSPPSPRPPAPPGIAAVTRDVPYVSDDTGTIAPGMGEREIYALWGPPAAVRRSGEFTYVFFQNGCEYTCGTMDVVTLQNDQVIDAIVRWPGHRYSGESSSPPGQIPVANPGGDTLRVPAPPPSTP